MKEHGLPLYLASELNMGLVDLQHKKRLGRSYAGLYCINETLFREGCITREAYEKYKAKYSSPLVQEKPEPLTKEQIERERKLEDLKEQFLLVEKQWETMKETSKEYYIEKAHEYVSIIPEAKKILVKAEK